MDPKVDSYSAFKDNEKKAFTALEGILNNAKISDIFCVGLSYDYCAAYTALNGNELGFNSYIISDACASFSKVKHSANILLYLCS